jgi:hypothetical protein
MAGMKLLKFLGIQPKVSPELLPDMASAQTAENTKLFSGDLIPYPYPKVVTGQYVTNGGTVQYFRPIRAFDNSVRWLVFETDVDVVESGKSDLIYDATHNDYRSERRFYYTGDGVPKQSSFQIMELWWIFYKATYNTSEVNEWYANGWASALTNKWGNPQYLELGMPIPEDGLRLSTSVSQFVNIGGSADRTFTFSRDNSGVVTVKSVAYSTQPAPTVVPTYVQSGTTVTVTYTAHQFRVDDIIGVTVATGTAVSGLYLVIAVTTNTFTYQAATSLSTSGTMYVYNSVTGSAAGEVTYGTVSGIRLSRTSNVVTLYYKKYTSAPRTVFDNFASGEYIKITNATNSAFNTATSGVPIISYTRSVGSTIGNLNVFTYTIQWVQNGVDITAANMTATISETFPVPGANPGTIATPLEHKLKSGLLVTISSMKYLTGSYSKANNTTLTISLTDHKLVQNQQVQLAFTTGEAQSGIYSVTSVVNANSFQVTIPSSTSTGLSGVVRLDFSSFNASNVEVQVVDDYTFTYYRPGFAYPETRNSDDAGIISRGGTKQARTYVYSYVSQWDEESIPSEPSDEIYLFEGEPVVLPARGINAEDNLLGIPWATAFGMGYEHFPTGNYRIRAVNVYRTLPAISGTEYYKLATLWYPTSIFVAARTSNVASVGFLVPHKLSVGDRFKIAGATGTPAGINGEWVVKDVTDPYNFTFDNTGTDFGVTATGVFFAASVFYDVSQNPILDAPRYYGEDGAYGFVDDFDSTKLFTILDSEDNDPPPENLSGLTEIQSDMLAGFVDHEIYFSRVGKPYAWPAKYVIKIEHKVVALVQSGGNLIALTNAYPYLITGSDPANMTPSKIDALFPCVSKRSVSTITGGVIYASNDGLVFLSPGSLPVIATKYAYNSETWAAALVPSTIVGGVSEETYVATHSTGGFAFDFGAQSPTFVTLTSGLTDTEATWYDPISDQLFLAGPTTGTNPAIFNISQWNDLTQPAAAMTWKSKVFVTKEPINLGAARVVADYTGSGDASINWEYESAYWGAVATSGDTFDTVNSSPNITLTNGNLSAKSTSPGLWYGAISTTSISTGKKYFELTQDVYDDFSAMIGLATSAADIGQPGTTFLGFNATSWSMLFNGTSYGGAFAYNNGGTTALGAGLTNNGDVASLAVDFDAGKIWFALNGTWVLSGDPAAGTGETFSFTPNTPLFAAISLLTTTAEVTVNFGAAFSYPVPTGFSAWSASGPAPSPVVTASWNAATPITFKIWVDKALLATIPVTDSKTFRLPTGYKSDTFEFGVEGDIRIRAIHVAETPTGLKEV